MPDAVTTSLRARTALEVRRGRLHPTLAEQLLAIDETVRLHRPLQLDGEEPEQAQHWIDAGFDDDAVVEWLEAGVPWSTAAQQLRDAGVTPREVAGQYEVGVTLGLAFARGEISLRDVFASRRSRTT